MVAATTIIDASGNATSQALPKPDSIDPQVVKAYSLDEYYGDSFSNNTPDPRTAARRQLRLRTVDFHLRCVRRKGYSEGPPAAPEQQRRVPGAELLARGLRHHPALRPWSAPQGYIYRWNNWYGGKVQILKYENGTFSVVRESATLEGLREDRGCHHVPDPRG